MAINTSKVVVGGLAAGVVMNVLMVVIQLAMLGKRMEAEMIAVAPTLQGKGMGTGAMVGRILIGFVLGILLTWLYAAMRPRFGPGPRTAFFAALAVWICGFVFYLDWLFLEMMTPVTYAMMSTATLVATALSALVGAMLYKEDASATM